MVTPIRGEEWVAPERADTPTSDGEKYLRSQLLVVSSRTRLLCSGCGEAKPLEAFNSSRRVVDGFAWWCRDCQREAQRFWRLGHRDAVEAYNVGRRVGPRWVKCSECDEVFVRRSNQVVCSRRCKDRRYRRLHVSKDGSLDGRGGEVASGRQVGNASVRSSRRHHSNQSDRRNCRGQRASCSANHGTDQGHPRLVMPQARRAARAPPRKQSPPRGSVPGPYAPFPSCPARRSSRLAPTAQGDGSALPSSVTEEPP